MRTPSGTGWRSASGFVLAVAGGLALLWFFGTQVTGTLPSAGGKVRGHGRSLSETPAVQGFAAPQFAMAGGEQRPEAAALERNNTGVALAQQRNWPAATAELRAALALDPDADSIRRNLQQVLLAWGMEELRSGKVSVATALLTEASELRWDADVEYWLGKSWLEQGDLGRAAKTWAAALQQFPEHPSLLFALGEVAERRDERAQALDYFIRARNAGLQSPGLDQKIERLAREVDAEWEYTITRSARFDFRHPTFERTDILDLVVASFEAAYDHLLATFGVGPTAPVRVVLYPSTDFYTVTRSPDWAGGAYSGRIQVPVGGLTATEREQLERVARHELTHALVTEWSGGQAPTWLQEGLAMWCEDNHPGERRQWAEALQRQAGGVSLGNLPQSLVGLEQKRAEVAYASSYLAVASLAERYGIHRLLAFAEACRERPWREAFVATFGHSFEDQ